MFQQPHSGSQGISAMRVIHGRGVQSALHWLHNLISHHVPLYYQENPRPFFPDWEGRQWWHVSTLLPVSCPRCPQGWNHRWELLDYFSLWRPQPSRFPRQPRWDCGLRRLPHRKSLVVRMTLQGLEGIEPRGLQTTKGTCLRDR